MEGQQFNKIQTIIYKLGWKWEKDWVVPRSCQPQWLGV